MKLSIILTKMGKLYIYGHMVYISKTTTLATVRGITKQPTAVLRNIKTKQYITDSYKVLEAYNDYILCDSAGNELV
jgi:hypothetical protein